MVRRLPAMQETRVRSLCWEDPPEKEIASHSSILAWKIPWTEEPGKPQSKGSQRVGHNWGSNTSLHPKTQMLAASIFKVTLRADRFTPASHLAQPQPTIQVGHRAPQGLCAVAPCWVGLRGGGKSSPTGTGAASEDYFSSQGPRRKSRAPFQQQRTGWPRLCYAND